MPYNYQQAMRRLTVRDMDIIDDRADKIYDQCRERGMDHDEAMKVEYRYREYVERDSVLAPF